MDTPVLFRRFAGEADLAHIMALIESELSEPYVIYTFRYFLHQWPHLSFLALGPDSTPVGVIVCKQSIHKDLRNRGYIAMLSVSKDYRKRGIASGLVQHSIEAMKQDGVEEIILETEYDNLAALGLYESFGFIREKRLHRFYLNGKDAFRLVLKVTLPEDEEEDPIVPALVWPLPKTVGKLSHAQLSRRAIPVIPYDDSDEDSCR